MTIKICVAGATGRVGRGLVRAIHQAEDLELVGAVSPTSKNQNLGAVVGNPEIKLTIDETVYEALDRKPDVLIDYTKPSVVKRHVLAAIGKNVHVVVGTSGLSDADYAEIDERARAVKVGVLAAGNFAITAVLLQQFALMAAKYLPHWEIVDSSYEGKPDAPSGTTRELAFRLSQVRTPVVHRSIDQTQGMKEARGATLAGSQIHSIRLPGFVSSAEIVFGMPGERLSIRHDSIDATEPYVAGTLLATRKVGGLVGLSRGLDSVMEF